MKKYKNWRPKYKKWSKRTPKRTFYGRRARGDLGFEYFLFFGIFFAVLFVGGFVFWDFVVGELEFWWMFRPRGEKLMIFGAGIFLAMFLVYFLVKVVRNFVLRWRGKGSVAELMLVSPEEFEKQIAMLYKKLGAENIKIMGGSGDKGVDILMNFGGERVAVQCKRYDPEKSYLSSPDLQKTEGGRSFYGASRVIVVTTTDKISGEAKMFARRVKMEVVNGKKLGELLASVGD